MSRSRTKLLVSFLAAAALAGGGLYVFAGRADSVAAADADAPRTIWSPPGWSRRAAIASSCRSSRAAASSRSWSTRATR